jgi:4-amino-4-deoxy-L-arabinose transferase-like glycosyltransferase
MSVEMRQLKRFFKWLEDNAALSLIMLIAFAARVHGISYGLPDQLHLDEVHVVSHAIRFGSGDFNPHFFYYPAFFMYLLFALYGAAYVIGHVLGVFPTAADFGIQYFIDPTMFYVIARVTAAAFGAGAAYVAAAAGARFATKRAGLLAAFLLALTPLHVEQSHFAITDVPLTFFMSLALYLAARLTTEGGLRNYVLCGIAAGLGTATKYTAAQLLPTMLFAHFIFAMRAKSGGRAKALFSFAPFVMFFAFGAAYLAGAPYSVLDFSSFIGDIKIQKALMNDGWFGMETPVNMWLHSIVVYLNNGMGVALLSASGCGIIYAAARRRPHELVFLCYIAVFYAINGQFSQFGFARHWLGVLPALCVLASVALDAASGLFKSRGRELAILAALAIMALPLKTVVKSNILFQAKDTRTLAREWIEKNAPSGAAFAVEYGGPQLAPTPESLLGAQELKDGLAAERVSGAVPLPAYDTRRPSDAEKNSEKKYHLAALERIKPKYKLVSSFSLAEYPLEAYTREGFEYIVVSGHIYERFFAAEDFYPEAVAFYRSLDKKAELLKEIPSSPKVRLGPTIKIYRLPKNLER